MERVRTPGSTERPESGRPCEGPATRGGTAGPYASSLHRRDEAFRVAEEDEDGVRAGRHQGELPRARAEHLGVLARRRRLPPSARTAQGWSSLGLLRGAP